MPLNYHQIDFTTNPPEVRVRDSQMPEAFPFAQQSRQHVAIINGASVMFNSLDEKFNAMVSEWRRLRDCGSSTDDLLNDAYGQIVAMGWPVVPMLLREIENESGHWFTALKWITGTSVVTPDIRGNIPAIREAWLEWGKACESQMKPPKASGSATTFQTFPSIDVNSLAGQRGTTTVLDSRSGIFAGGSTTTATSITGQTVSIVANGPAAISRR